MSDLTFNDDQSLQRWGANLKNTEDAAGEVARLYAEAEAAKERFTSTFGQMSTQGENDLPTSDRLMSEVQSIHVRATGATTADAWRAVAADAGTLPTTYQREHETDEDRLYTPRKSQAAEKRADVTTAAADN